MSVSEEYLIKTGRRFLHSIMPIQNVPSVIRSGILCHELADHIEHKSIAMSEVQSRRDRICVPKGMNLHQYVNLYLDSRNPMLFLRKDLYESLCILEVDLKVLELDGAIMTDRNAASVAEFLEPEEGIQRIDFDRVFSRYWTHGDYMEYLDHKAVKCAEVLVPERVAYHFIMGAIVGTNSSQERMRGMGFTKPIQIDRDAFFQIEGLG